MEKTKGGKKAGAIESQRKKPATLCRSESHPWFVLTFLKFLSAVVILHRAMIGIKNLGYDQNDLFIESNVCVAWFEEYNLMCVC